ncbi:MAG: M56 family metallopeptidase, partial [Maribacter sp.]|nr:M56 family metallopeptidase [Maribacter sp.]
METVLIYLLKVSGILTIFYLAYQAFLKRETFFSINRQFLISGIVTALLLPFVSLTNYIEIEATPINLVATQTAMATPIVEVRAFNWTALLFGIYSAGLLIFSTKFIVQLLSLFKLIKRNKIAKQGKFYHVETHKNIAPFSFFNHIFYNPTMYSPSELSAILKHEKAHSSQWHSIDVILSYLVAIGTWMNPFSWLYQNKIKQNLEFLADESATKEVMSVKKYQYTLLKVSGNQFFTPIVNNFYNSLIKKRIVMLNKSKSNKRNILKIALILPILAIFLVSFNTKDVYIPIEYKNGVSLNTESTSEIIEITIDKNTTDKQLSEIKKDLAKKGVDFSYTVVHNSKNEITDISIDFSVKKENGKTVRSSSNFNNGDDPIDPIHIFYDEDTNSISMGSKKHMYNGIHKEIHIDTDEDTDKTIWVHADNEGDELKTIEIREENGKETIRVNGKKVTRKEFDAMKDKDGIHKKRIKIINSDNDKEKNVFIMKMSDDEEDES